MDWVAVVDDDVTILKMAGKILSRNNMRVTAMKSGTALLDYVKTNRPDLILLDIRMPQMDGFETLKLLRQQNPEDPIPVVFLTADESEETRSRAIEAGALEILKKPFEPEALSKRIKEIIRKEKEEALVNEIEEEDRTKHAIDLKAITSALRDQESPYDAMWLGRDAFISIYRYMVRYMERYHGTANHVLFLLDTDVKEEMERRRILKQFRRLAQHSLRSSDAMMEIGDDSLFLLLPESRQYDIDRIVSRLLKQWEQSEYGALTKVRYEAGQVELGREEKPKTEESEYRVAVVDDDEVNLRMAELVLQKENIRVTKLTSGQALLDYVKTETPDLILLDFRMPEMDGLETLRRLKQQMVPGSEIPVIFLTADENRETEIEALRLGAVDLIRKPLIAEILVLRVRHTIDLVRLQNNLAAEVEKKARENESLSLHVVIALAEAIDAKDTYTNGHSSRVAEYAREIARRFGYSSARQDEIYMMGLLHDVGKIGVPDTIINKPGKLTDEEYEIIKTHPVLGDRILKKIREMPKLAVGARWHHERYDGRGYPDGLAGTDILEEARIIAVADAYDAMTSRRSYRPILPQETVKSEIETGRGTQFDPAFADIMLEIIAEDNEYRLREL